MNDLERAMKYYILLTLGSSAAVPIFGEMYANVSTSFALVCLAAWTIFAGIKLSRFDTKPAMLAITAHTVSTVVMSLIGFCIFHPVIKGWIEKHSQYFDIGLHEWARYFTYAFLLILLPFPIFFLRLGFKAARGKLKQNAQSAASAVDNAFDEVDDDEF